MADYAPIPPTTFDELAAELKLSAPQLKYWAYAVKPRKAYRSFTIAKRDGSSRHIDAPTPVLMGLQKRLLLLLNRYYDPPGSTHGFVPARSIVSNAKPHVGRRNILKVDIEDFFPSIHFGRVRGILLAQPFGFTDVVATVIAQLCCHDRRLPQGAPTSPLLSNLACRKMDRDLVKLTRQCGAYVTRYADDITISTNRRHIPNTLALSLSSGPDTHAEIGDGLRHVIESNGFHPRDDKTRILRRSHRQIVTGIVVNKRANTPREMIRKVRGMLHAWRKYGEANAQHHLETVHYSHNKSPDRSFPKFRDVLRGRMEYIRMVRGSDDALFIRLAKQARELDPDLFTAILEPLEHLENSLWVIESFEDEIQGTGFLLDGVGLVTCHHVVGSNCVAHQPHNPASEYPVSVRCQSKELDVAVLDGIPTTSALEAAKYQPARHTLVRLAGFPGFAPGHTAYVERGEITAYFKRFAIEHFTISCKIAGGASGGPVVDEDYKVLGIAVTGAESLESAQSPNAPPFGVIPISAIEQL